MLTIKVTTWIIILPTIYKCWLPFKNSFEARKITKNITNDFRFQQFLPQKIKLNISVKIFCIHLKYLIGNQLKPKPSLWHVTWASCICKFDQIQNQTKRHILFWSSTYSLILFRPKEYVFGIFYRNLNFFPRS